jgi:hypothetical protein
MSSQIERRVLGLALIVVGFASPLLGQQNGQLCRDSMASMPVRFRARNHLCQHGPELLCRPTE